MPFVASGESITHQHIPVCEDSTDYLVCYLQGQFVDAVSYEDDFMYVYVPFLSILLTPPSFRLPLYPSSQGENWSYKDLQNQVMTMPTLEYHNKNWTWTDMLMEVKKDYKNAIIHQVR